MIVEDIRVGGYTCTSPQLLAEGGFGLVYSVTSNGGTYVLKKCSIQRQEEFNIVQKEVKILDKLRDCQYAVSMLASQVSPHSKEGLILMEMCSGGHLLDRLNRTRSNGKFFDKRTICQIFGQIVSGVRMMHEWNPVCTNRDLKLENVLFGGTDGNTVKLCDFGSAVFGNVLIRNQTEKSNEEEIINKETTPAYRAPEMVDLYMRPVLTFKTDMWALGCILYTMCYCCHPFQEAGNLGTLNGITSFPHMPHPVSNDLQTLIQRLCDIDPEARPDTAQVADAISAIHQGQCMPPYSVSAEALELRREREEQAARRAEKDEMLRRKNAARGQNSILASKRADQGKVVGGSVAARRLARMRGGGGGGGGGGEVEGFSDDWGGDFDNRNSNNNNATFGGRAADAFGSSEDLLGGGGSGGGFDDIDFGGSSSSNANAFDDFGSAAVPAAATTDAFGAGGDFFSGTEGGGGGGVSTVASSSDAGGFGGDPFGVGSPKVSHAGHEAASSFFGDTTSTSSSTAAAAVKGSGFDQFGGGGELSSDPFGSNAAGAVADPFGGGDAFGSSQPQLQLASSSSFSEFGDDAGVPETPSRPLSEAFGSTNTAAATLGDFSSAAATAAVADTHDEGFGLPPSSVAFGTGGGGGGGGGEFDSFSPAPSRPMSGAFDEFSSLPNPAGEGAFNSNNNTPLNTSIASTSTAGAAFSSLPSAPATPYSSMKFEGTPIPVAQPVSGGPREATPPPMACVVGKTEEVSVGGQEFVVDALHNMSFKGSPRTPPKVDSGADLAGSGSGSNAFDFSDDGGPSSDAWDAGAAARLSVPSSARGSDPFGSDLLVATVAVSTGRMSVGGEMDADLFGDSSNANGPTAPGTTSMTNSPQPQPQQQQQQEQEQQQGSRRRSGSGILSLFDSNRPNPAGAMYSDGSNVPGLAPMQGATNINVNSSSQQQQQSQQPVMLRSPTNNNSSMGGAMQPPMQQQQQQLQMGASPNMNAMRGGGNRAPAPLHTTTSFGVMQAPGRGGTVALHTGRGSLGQMQGQQQSMMGAQQQQGGGPAMMAGGSYTGAMGGGGMGASMTGGAGGGSMPQITPMGMDQNSNNMSAMQSSSAMRPPPQQQQQQFQGGGSGGNEFANSAFGLSLQPAGYGMQQDQQDCDGFSPMPSPANSRPNSMGLRAPPAAVLSVTRGHVAPSAGQASAAPDPFGGLASFK